MRKLFKSRLQFDFVVKIMLKNYAYWLIGVGQNFIFMLWQITNKWLILKFNTILSK